MSVVSLAHPPRIRSRATTSRRWAVRLLHSAFAAYVMIVRELRLRRDMRRLGEFSDHMLHDIGISRADIEGVVRRGRDGLIQRSAACPNRTARR